MNNPYLYIKKTDPGAVWEGYKVDNSPAYSASVTINKSVDIIIDDETKTITLANIVWAKDLDSRIETYIRYLLNGYWGNTHAYFYGAEASMDLVQSSRNNFYPLTGTLLQIDNNYGYYFILSDLVLGSSSDDETNDGFLLFCLLNSAVNF